MSDYHVCDNPKVLNQDCNRKLFNWFLSRIDWRRILKQMSSGKTDEGGKTNG